MRVSVGLERRRVGGQRQGAAQKERETGGGGVGDGPRRIDWMWMSESTANRGGHPEAMPLTTGGQMQERTDGTHTQKGATVPREVTLLQKALGLI